MAGWEPSCTGDIKCYLCLNIWLGNSIRWGIFESAVLSKKVRLSVCGRTGLAREDAGGLLFRFPPRPCPALVSPQPPSSVNTRPSQASPPQQFRLRLHNCNVTGSLRQSEICRRFQICSGWGRQENGLIGTQGILLGYLFSLKCK